MPRSSIHTDTVLTVPRTMFVFPDKRGLEMKRWEKYEPVGQGEELVHGKTLFNPIQGIVERPEVYFSPGLHRHGIVLRRNI